MTTHLHLDSPLGRLTLIAADGALTGIYLPRQVARGLPAPLSTGTGRSSPLRTRRGPLAPVLREAARQLTEYFDHRRKAFDLPLAPAGTPFQRAVWDQLARIPFGETRAYSDLARALDRPRAARAVGAANGQNPLSIVVPCHRVLGRDGRLHGYAGGEPAKRWLLDHEAIQWPRERSPESS